MFTRGGTRHVLPQNYDARNHNLHSTVVLVDAGDVQGVGYTTYAFTPYACGWNGNYATDWEGVPPVVCALTEMLANCTLFACTGYQVNKFL